MVKHCRSCVDACWTGGLTCLETTGHVVPMVVSRAHFFDLAELKSILERGAYGISLW